MRPRTAALAMALSLVLAACTGAAPQPSEATPPGAAQTTPTLSPAGGLACWTAEPAAGTAGITLTNATEALGLIEPLTGIYGHAAAWGDVDGDLVADLVVGTFANRRAENYLVRGATGPAPDRLLSATADGFVSDPAFPERRGRTSGAAVVDLDGDGDLDLVMARNATDRDPALPGTEVLENEGGTFTVVEDPGLATSTGGRSVGVLDADQDGILDLLILEDRYGGGSSRLYRGLGSVRFEQMDFPSGVHGLGLATGDLNGDRLTDVFVGGSNRLFVGSPVGLSEVDAPGLAWESAGPEDDVAGAAMADVNRDGLLDLLVGHHYNSTLSRSIPRPVRLYLNRTVGTGAVPEFEDVTDVAGLSALPTKAPHVELVDFDNDGWPDILTTASAHEGDRPAIFRHLGIDEVGVPRFEAPTGLGSAQYWVTGPTHDVDRDGRPDVLLVEWEPALPSLLLTNATASGHWLEVSVDSSLGGGVGTRVDVYSNGGAGDLGDLLGSREIVASLGYTAGVAQVAHFGLGDESVVDVVVTPPPPDPPVVLEAVAADRHLRLPSGCGS